MKDDIHTITQLWAQAERAYKTWRRGGEKEADFRAWQEALERYWDERSRQTEEDDA